MNKSVKKQEKMYYKSGVLYGILQIERKRARANTIY